MIKFTTINVDGVKVTREFNTVEEIKKDWYSDDCTLPANDDVVIYAELDGIQLHYPKIFEDLLEELGVEVGGKNMNEHIISANLREDGVLEIYHGDKLMCTVGDGRTDEEFVEDVLYCLGYQWNEDGTIAKLYDNCDDN